MLYVPRAPFPRLLVPLPAGGLYGAETLTTPARNRGNGRLEAMCFDGVRRLANIRGKLRKKTWINQGDIILLSRTHPLLLSCPC